MDYKLNFAKDKISKQVCEYIEANIDGEEEKKSMNRILKGNKVQYKEANNLSVSGGRAV